MWGMQQYTKVNFGKILCTTIIYFSFSIDTDAQHWEIQVKTWWFTLKGGKIWIWIKFELIWKAFKKDVLGSPSRLNSSVRGWFLSLK